MNIDQQMISLPHCTAGGQPILIKSLKSDDSRLRFYAVFYLGKLGPEARDALPELNKLVNDESSRFRRFLEKTVGDIKGEEKE